MGHWRRHQKKDLEKVEATALATFMNVTRTAVHMAGGGTRHWSEPGVSPSQPNADYHPDKLTLAHP